MHIPFEAFTKSSFRLRPGFLSRKRMSEPRKGARTEVLLLQMCSKIIIRGKI